MALTASLRWVIAALAVTSVCFATPASAAAPEPAAAPAISWQPVDTGVDARFTGVEALGEGTAWTWATWPATVMATFDGGATFTDVTDPRWKTDGVWVLDIEALRGDDALLLASEADTSTSIYRTTDGGGTWRQTYHPGPEVGSGCMTMSSRRDGLLVTTQVGGRFQLSATHDAGRSWDAVEPVDMPLAAQGEMLNNFTGDCADSTRHSAWFGTSYLLAGPTRVFRTTDDGLTWSAAGTGIDWAIGTVDFRTERLGLATGLSSMARSTDGGVTWKAVAEPPEGSRTDVAWWADRRGNTDASVPDPQKIAIAVGPTGSDYSADRGRTWQQFDSELYFAVDCAQDTQACWSVGKFGRAAKLVVG